MIEKGSAVYRAGIDRLEGLKGRNDPDAVKAVAREMEALFAYEMLKAMREASTLSEGQGMGNGFYMSMFDMEVARVISERGMGISDVLLKGLRVEGALQVSKAAPLPESKSVSVTSQAEDPREQVTSKHQVPAQFAVDRVGQAEHVLPVEGRITSGFGERMHPISKDYRFHRGVDIAAPMGTQVRAMGKGTVVFSGWRQGYGNTVIIDHGDGTLSRYAHNSENLVKAGDEVEAGTVIGHVGSTGRSTGPHLHVEVVRDGEPVDPIQFMTNG